jgi:hypothetical protein
VPSARWKVRVGVIVPELPESGLFQLDVWPVLDVSSVLVVD